MSFLRFFNRDTSFFDNLENGAREALNGATTMRKLLQALGNGPTETLLGDLAQCRRKHKRIANEVSEALIQTFMTPLDREDIETLSNALYRISKTIEKTGERLTICPPGSQISVVDKEVENIERACVVIVEMVGQLRKGPRLDEVRAAHEQLQSVEGEADKQLLEHLRELYRGDRDARAIMFWKDLYDLLEKITDRCRDVGNIVFQIILKNS